MKAEKLPQRRKDRGHKGTELFRGAAVGHRREMVG